jgi:hypothetical protein
MWVGWVNSVGDCFIMARHAVPLQELAMVLEITRKMGERKGEFQKTRNDLRILL